MARARTIDELEELRPRVDALLRGGRAGDAAPRCTSRTSARTTRRWSTTTTSPSCTAPTRSRSGAPPSEDGAGHLLDRHGQRVARDAVDPSVPRHRDRRRGQPPTGVRPGRDQRVGRPGGRRRRARHGVDRDRRRDRAAPRRACSRADRPSVAVVASRSSCSAPAAADDDHAVDVAALGRRRRRERLHLRALARPRPTAPPLRGRGPVLHSTVLPCWSWSGPVVRRLRLVRVVHLLQLGAHARRGAGRGAAVQHDDAQLGRASSWAAAARSWSSSAS